MARRARAVDATGTRRPRDLAAPVTRHPRFMMAPARHVVPDDPPRCGTAGRKRVRVRSRQAVRTDRPTALRAAPARSPRLGRTACRSVAPAGDARWSATSPPRPPPARRCRFRVERRGRCAASSASIARGAGAGPQAMAGWRRGPEACDLGASSTRINRKISNIERGLGRPARRARRDYGTSFGRRSVYQATMATAISTTPCVSRTGNSPPVGASALSAGIF